MIQSYSDIKRFPADPDFLFELSGQALLMLGWDYRCDRHGQLIATIPGSQADCQSTLTIQVFEIGAVCAKGENLSGTFFGENLRHVDLFFTTLNQLISSRPPIHHFSETAR